MLIALAIKLLSLNKHLRLRVYRWLGNRWQFVLREVLGIEKVPALCSVIFSRYNSLSLTPCTSFNRGGSTTEVVYGPRGHVAWRRSLSPTYSYNLIINIDGRDNFL